MTASMAHADDTVLLHAAGSLRSALTDVAGAFKTATGTSPRAQRDR